MPAARRFTERAMAPVILACAFAVVGCGGGSTGNPAAPSKAILQEQGTLSVTCVDQGCVWTINMKNVGTACANDIGGTARFMDGNGTIIYTSDIFTGKGPIPPGSSFDVAGPSGERGPRVLLEAKGHKLDLTWKDVTCQCQPGHPCVVTSS